MILWTYWESKDNFTKIHQKCLDLIDKNADIKHIHLTRETIENYIEYPEFLDKFSYVAQKSDYIRAMLIKTYGGFWIDLDNIFFGNILQLKKYYDNDQFISFVPRDDLAKHKASISFIGANKNNNIVNKWVDNMNKYIKQENYKFNFNALNFKCLYPTLKKNMNNFYNVDKNLIMPIHWKNTKYFFDKDYNININNNQISIMLTHIIMKRLINNKQFLTDKYLIGRLFKKSKKYNE